jgi:hypothetical protein
MATIWKDYIAEKQADGTYNIRESGFRDVLVSGVRGCNVDRIINGLIYDDDLLGR